MALQVSTAMSALLLALSTAHGGTVYESASVGATGLPADEFLTQQVPGSNIGPDLYQGVRFELFVPTQITRIGGHFVGIEGGETLFGAVIALMERSDLPNSAHLSTDDVLGTTIIQLPTLSGDAFGDLPLVLDPGWYAVAFGSGLFGADGIGIVPRNNTEIAMPQYITRQLIIPGNGWADQLPHIRDYRFVVEGFVVPEPASLGMVFMAILCLAFRRRRGKIGGRSHLVSSVVSY